MSRLFIAVVMIALGAACSGLETLTPKNLDAAEGLWIERGSDFYRLSVEMSGERVEAGVFDVLVRGGTVVSIERNGMPIRPDGADDYSVEGLFDILRQELALAEEPSVLGAPAGYSAHLLVRFDEETGRLVRYRRTVGGASNNIEIDVLGYESLAGGG